MFAGLFLKEMLPLIFLLLFPLFVFLFVVCFVRGGGVSFVLERPLCQQKVTLSKTGDESTPLGAPLVDRLALPILLASFDHLVDVISLDELPAS